MISSERTLGSTDLLRAMVPATVSPPDTRDRQFVWESATKAPYDLFMSSTAANASGRRSTEALFPFEAVTCTTTSQLLYRSTWVIRTATPAILGDDRELG